MPNTNCLEGIKCPACGSEGKFDIEATTTATVTDAGVEEHGDMEWDDDSDTRCAVCLRHGPLEDFRVGADSSQGEAA